MWGAALSRAVSSIAEFDIADPAAAGQPQTVALQSITPTTTMFCVVEARPA
jgi:hypothetical protein